MTNENFEGEDKNLILFHEIAHSIFWDNFPKELFQKSPLGDPDFEVVANDFGWWIYGQKYVEEYEFSRMVLTEEKIRYFESVCNLACVDEILKIKVE